MTNPPQTLFINGRQLAFENGETLLEVARRHDIDIPTLCWLKGATPTGACRICVVEVEGARTLLTACTTPAAPGMDVQTESPAQAPECRVEISIQDARRMDISNGQRIRIRSRRGVIVAKAAVSNDILPGVVFIPFHFAAAAANRLTHAALDPVCHIPELKVCAVGLEPADEALKRGTA